jgi:hypothetical protein
LRLQVHNKSSNLGSILSTCLRAAFGICTQVIGVFLRF